METNLVLTTMMVKTMLSLNTTKILKWSLNGPKIFFQSIFKEKTALQMVLMEILMKSDMGLM